MVLFLCYNPAIATTQNKDVSFIHSLQGEMSVCVRYLEWTSNALELLVLFSSVVNYCCNDSQSVDVWMCCSSIRPMLYSRHAVADRINTATVGSRAGLLLFLSIDAATSR